MGKQVRVAIMLIVTNDHVKAIAVPSRIFHADYVNRFIYGVVQVFKQDIRMVIHVFTCILYLAACNVWCTNQSWRGRYFYFRNIFVNWVKAGVRWSGHV